MPLPVLFSTGMVYNICK